MDKERLSVVSAIALNTVFGNDPKFSHNIIEALGSTEAVFSLSGEELTELFGPFSRFGGRIDPGALELAGRQYDELSSRGIQFLSIFDPGYPAILKECPDAPLLLYVNSRTPAAELFNRAPMISVVGTRDISLYGREWCRRIVESLASAPIKPVIVSGLAIGVDITAHMAALECGLPTIGVSPVGIDSIYPVRHTASAGRIMEFPGGALVTDYPPGTPAMQHNFLRRNRIIAGLSTATILVESKIRGGGMMTARLAFGYGRDVYALPGRIDDLRSQGCNHLVREKVAEPVSDLGALTEALGLGSRPQARAVPLEQKVRQRLTHMQGEALANIIKVAEAVKAQRGVDFDALCSICGMEYSSVAYCAGMLETEGIITIDILQRCCINSKI